MKKNLSLSILRVMALIVVLIGAAGSLYYVLRAGRNNNSILLVSLFVSWVLSPFIAQLLANVIFRRWSVFTRGTLYCLTILLAVGSLFGYSGALTPPGTMPAFVFLMIPLISWLLMGTVIPLAASLARRKNSV